ERVVRILDGLAREMENRQLALTPSGKAMSIAQPPDSVVFSLIERVEMRKHQPTLEELAEEERRNKKRERDTRLGRWAFGSERAYPEADPFRTGELSLQIADQYVGGLAAQDGHG